MDRPPITKLLYTPAEAAVALGTSRRSVYKLIAAGDLPAVRPKPGGDLRIPAVDLAAYVERLREEQLPPWQLNGYGAGARVPLGPHSRQLAVLRPTAPASAAGRSRRKSRSSGRA